MDALPVQRNSCGQLAPMRFSLIKFCHMHVSRLQEWISFDRGRTSYIYFMSWLMIFYNAMHTTRSHIFLVTFVSAKSAGPQSRRWQLLSKYYCHEWAGLKGPRVWRSTTDNSKTSKVKTFSIHCLKVEGKGYMTRHYLDSYDIAIRR